MPAGSGDKPQQPKGSGFHGSDLYPNKSIWHPTFPSSRDRSNGAKDADENPTGSSALNANSEADAWGTIAWNSENPSRSVNNSPGRSREAVIPTTSTSVFYDHHNAIGTKKNPFGVGSFPEDPDPYATSFVTSKRAAPEAAYSDPLGHFAAPRDGSLPPSRHSQGSPHYVEIYPGTHTPSNSIHAQRQMSNHAMPFVAAHNGNQRGISLSRQVEDDVALRLARHLSLDNANTNGLPFNPASQPFHPWPVADNNVSRFGSGMDFHPELAAAHLAVMKRHSIDRISHSPSGYRLDSSNSPRSHFQTPESWMTKSSSSRDPRTMEYERRASTTQFNSNYPQYYTPSQYPYGNVPAPFPSGFPDPYSQNYRPPMMPGYSLPPLHPGYHLSPVMSPIRPSRDQDPGRGMRSVLLDEFRTSNKSSKRYELRDIFNYVVEFSGDQHGSRFIQQKLETANSDEKDQVFREIEPNAVQLMKDVFGNYVVQKFFEHGNQLQKKLLGDKMKGKMVDLSTQVYACRVVQKALEHVLVEQQAELTKELEQDVLKVGKDQNGNHVVQKIIELVPRGHIDFIMNALRGQVTALASHQYGCRIVQRMLEHGTEADKAEIMGELHASAQILITDQYGNYVTQHVIQQGKPEDREKMIQLVLAQLLTYSKHKFASNVVEKCIEFGTSKQRTFICEQLTTVSSDGFDPLPQIMRDQYGNYVLQKLVSALQGAELEAVVEEVKPHFYSLKRSGSKQLQALEKLLGAAKGEISSTQSDTNSMAAETPDLTNETNSPQSTSPPSTHVSAVSIRADDSGKRPSGVTEVVVLRVQDEEA